MDLGYRCSLLYKAFWGEEEEKEQIRVKIERKNELRRYMGPKWARVPRGAIVRLIAVINGKMGIFEWNGERFNCPVRLLHRINKQTKEEFEKELMEVYGRAIEKFTETRLRVEFKRADELLIERFEEWLIENNYSESYIRKCICYIKRIFREIGFPTVEKFDEKYGWRPSTVKSQLSNTFYRFQEFLRSSLTEEKKGKGVKRSVFIDVDGDCEVWRDEG